MHRSKHHLWHSLEATSRLLRKCVQTLQELFRDAESAFPQRVASRPEVYEAARKRTQLLMEKIYGIGNYGT
jgi:hypothetical protein